MIIVDRREPDSICRRLVQLGVEVKRDMLPVGDYFIPSDSESIVVERKTNFDFVNSLVSARLWHQLKMLLEADALKVLIIEGSLYPVFRFRKINKLSVAGAIASLMKRNIHVISSYGKDFTAIILQALELSTRRKSSTISLPRVAPKEDIHSQAVYFLCGLPNVGKVLAERLLSHFGSVRNIVNASAHELAEVSGISFKHAKKLVDIFNHKHIS